MVFFWYELSDISVSAEACVMLKYVHFYISGSTFCSFPSFLPSVNTAVILAKLFFVLLLNLQATTCWFSRAEVRKSRITELCVGPVLSFSTNLNRCTATVLALGFLDAHHPFSNVTMCHYPLICSFLHTYNMEDFED